MKNALGISVPQPCSEKWESFNKTSAGGFCGSCQKEIIDFSTWTDEQIKLYFKNRKQPTCGRFATHQLKTYTLYEPATPASRWMPLSALGLSMMLTLNSAQAQTVTQPAQQSIVDSQNSSSQSSESINQTSVVITGTVLSYDSLPLANIHVSLKGTPLATQTDDQGKFILTIDNPQATDTLVFTRHRYFETVELAINGENNFTVMMMEAVPTEVVVTMGIVMTTEYEKPTLWQRIKDIFR